MSGDGAGDHRRRNEGPGRAVGRLDGEHGRGALAAGRPGRARPGVDDGLLVVLDGAKALSAAVREVFGAKAAVQRCTLHKRRNVADHLPDKEKALVDAKLVKAFGHPDPDEGLRNAKHGWRPAGTHTPAPPGRCGGTAGDVHRRQARHRRPPRQDADHPSNPVESMISIARATNRNVTAGATGRWCCAGPRPACSTPNEPSAASRATNRCPNSSPPSPTRPPRTHRRRRRTVGPPPRVHRGSSPKFHTPRDML